LRLHEFRFSVYLYVPAVNGILSSFHALLILQRRQLFSLPVKFSYYLGFGLVWFVYSDDLI